MPMSSRWTVAEQRTWKRVWHCWQCGRFAYVFHAPRDGSDEVESLAADQHAITDKDCHAQNSDRGIQLLGIATEVEWQSPSQLRL